jgi:methyl-accepting chemotaxis protein
MGLIHYYEQHRWIRSAAMISLVVLSILIIIILAEVSFKQKMQHKNMTDRCREISASIVGGMTDALAAGENDVVRNQFRRLHDLLPEIDVYVYDAQAVISFSTDQTKIGTSFNGFLNQPDIVAKNNQMLSTGDDGGIIKRQIGDKLYFGTLMPSLNEETCFGCHDSAQKVIGGIAVLVDNSSSVKAIKKSFNLSLMVGMAGVILVVFLIWFVFSRMAKQLNTTMDEIRDTSDSVAGLAHDTKEISKKIDTHASQGSEMVDHVISAATEISEYITNIAAAAEQVSSQINDVDSNSTHVSTELIASHKNIEAASSNMSSVAAAAEQMSFSVNTVATAMEQMYASQGEITKSSSRCAAITNDASMTASETVDTVNTLAESADQIGDIIDLINGIAGKTNLLALNAAIEAAGAGEAGKGFAVVAKEVKELAKQTAAATLDIRKKIKGMQKNTSQAIDAIKEITKIITEVDGIMGVIASSVEEQTATTNEVTRNVAESAESADAVAKNINLAANKIQEVAESMTHIKSLEINVSGNLKQTANAVGEIAKDVAVSSQRAGEALENVQQMGERMNDISNNTGVQNKQTDQLASIAVRLKELTRAFRI